MPVPTSLADLSVTASANSPQGTDSAKGSIDDYFRAHAALIAQLNVDVASSANLTAINAAIAELVATVPTTRTAQIGYIEQHFTGFFGRGMLTAEVINVATEQALVGSFALGATTLVMTDAAQIVVGGCVTVKHDNGRYGTYFVDSKATNNIGIRPALRYACATAASRIERTWFNSAHPGKFYMRELAQRIANATEFDCSAPNGSRVLFTNVASNPNTTEDTLVALGGAAISYFAESNLGETGTVASPVRFALGRGGYVGNINAVSDGAETQAFNVDGAGAVVVKVAFYSNSAASQFAIQVLDELNVERGKFVIPTGANHQVIQIHTLPADLTGAKTVRVRIACETLGVPGAYFVINQIDVFKAPGMSGKLIPATGAKIVCLGDSWAGGDLGSTLEREPYPQQLALELPYATIINAGIGGNNISQMLARFTTDVTVHAPDIVIINSGTNECYSPFSGTFDPNAINEFNYVFRRLLNAVAAIGARAIVVGVPALAQTDADVPAFAEWLLNDRAKLYARYVFETQAAKPILSYGTTSNGSWVKFADGTMIARHTVTVTVTAANTLTASSWTYPIQFAATPHVVASFSDYNSSQAVSIGTFAATATAVSVRAFTGTSALSVPVTCVATGRWR